MTRDPGTTLMFMEAAESGAAVARQRRANADKLRDLARDLRVRLPRAIVTCARGSSDHAATFAKYLIETRLSVLVSSAAPSVTSLYGARQRLADVLAIAISQSGKSPDLLATLDAAKAAGAEALVLANVADSPLARRADHLLALHAGPERSVAATKSYIATLAAIADFVRAMSGDAALEDALDQAPDLLGQAWAADWSPLVDALAPARGLFVVGRGVGLGVAQEAALKLKETCGLHAEAFSAAELKHGPMALVGTGFPLLVLRQSDEAGDGIEDLAAEMAARGGPVFIAGGTAKGAIGLPGIAAHPVIEPMLHIQSFYRAANALSLRRGFDPDRPPHLAKVTETL